MKRNIFCVVFLLLACISVNAQNVEDAINMEMAMTTETQVAEAIADEPIVTQEIAAELARPTLLNHAMLENEDYKNNQEWQRARGLRTAGIIVTSIGSAEAIGMGILAITEANKENLGGVFSGMLATGCAFIGAGAAIAGTVMWIVGNSKMKKVRLASTGTGLAYTF